MKFRDLEVLRPSSEGEDIVNSPNKYRETEGIKENKDRQGSQGNTAGVDKISAYQRERL